jgi:N-acetyl-gamma-glutamyl-phosphate reductase
MRPVPAPPLDAPAPSAAVNVAVVGATGYAGQELVRLLARHPVARIALATASRATSVPRRLPGLARIFDGDIRPLDLAEVTAAADVVFLALPEKASAEVAPACLAAGQRVIDLSGAFRLTDDAARARHYPATGAMP